MHYCVRNVINQRGFLLTAILLAILFLALLGIIGWLV